ncbi:MAG: hypothetical protein ACKVOL_15180 [Novosphingobium sp.]
MTTLLMVAGLLVIGSCSLLFPPKRPEQSWANGTYRNACCAPLVLRNGSLSSERRSSAYRIEPGKHGYILNVPEGISVEAGHVLFGGDTVYMEFNDASGLHRADYHAKNLSINNREVGGNLIYVRQ